MLQQYHNRPGLAEKKNKPGQKLNWDRRDSEFNVFLTLFLLDRDRHHARTTMRGKID